MSTLRLLSWNVNGIRAGLKKGFLEWMAEANPDVLCIQETKAQPEQLPKSLTEMEGYHAYYASAERKGYSGVAIYTKREPQSVTVGFGVDEFDSEGRTLVADYGDFLLYAVYFPNGRSSEIRLDYKMRFYDAFLEHIDAQTAAGRSVVICGDVNTAHKAIDLARPKENEKVSGFLAMEREWVDKLLEHGHLDTFRMFNDEPGNYTYWDMVTRRGTGTLGGASTTSTRASRWRTGSRARSSCRRSWGPTTAPSASTLRWAASHAEGAPAPPAAAGGGGAHRGAARAGVRRGLSTRWTTGSR